MQIPIYNNKVLPSAKTGVPHSLPGERSTPMRAVSEASRWAALNKTSDDMFNIGQKIEHAEAQSEYADNLIKLKEGYSQIKQDLKTNASYNEFTVQEYEEKNVELSTKLQSDVLSGISNSDARDKLTLASREMGISSRMVAQDIGYNKFIDRGRSKLIENLQTLQDDFITTGDVENLTYASAMVDGAVDAGFYSEQEGLSIADKFSTNAISGMYETQMNENPVELYNKIVRDDKEPEAWSKLPETYKEKLTQKLKLLYGKKMNESKIATIGSWENMSIDAPEKTWNTFKEIPRKKFGLLNNREYATLKKKLKGAYKSTLDKGVDPVEKGRLNRSLADSLSMIENTGIQLYGIEEKIADTYSATPETRKQGKAKLEQYQSDAHNRYSTFAVKEDIKNGDLAHNAQYLKDIKPKEGTNDFKTKQEAFNTAAEEYNRKLKLMGEDPKKLFDSYFPKKRPTSLDPATRLKENQVYRGALTDWYKEQGLPESKWKVMTKDEASLFVNEIPNRSAKDIMDSIKQIDSGYGTLSKYAFRDLRDAGMSPELSIIANLSPTERETIGYDLVEASKLKDKTLTDALGEDTKDIKKDVTDNINNNDTITNYVNSLYTTGTTASNVRTGEDLKKAIRNLSYVYKLRGFSTDDATEKAINGIMKGRYNYVEQDYLSNKVLRIPALQSAELTKKAMNITLDNIEGKDLSTRYFKEGASKIQNKMDGEILIENLKAKGGVYWRNGVNENSDKAILINNTTDLPVYGKDEKPIMMDLKDIKSITAKKKVKTKKVIDIDPITGTAMTSNFNVLSSLNKYMKNRGKTLVAGVPLKLSEERILLLQASDKAQRDKIRAFFKRIKTASDKALKEK